jgi:hypothetical protein
MFAFSTSVELCCSFITTSCLYGPIVCISIIALRTDCFCNRHWYGVIFNNNNLVTRTFLNILRYAQFASDFFCVFTTPTSQDSFSVFLFERYHHSTALVTEFHETVLHFLVVAFRCQLSILPCPQQRRDYSGRCIIFCSKKRWKEIAASIPSFSRLVLLSMSSRLARESTMSGMVILPVIHK